MKNSEPIGILDSGVGGLSIWKEIVKQLPNEQTIYIADSKNCPYGGKSKAEIYQLAKLMVEFLLRKKVKLLVLACNTITVCCLDKLRVNFPKVPIVGIVPVVKTAAEQTKNKNIGILSTPATARSVYQKNLVDKFANKCRVTSVGTDKLVPFVERGEVDTREVKNVLEKELNIFKTNKVDAIALGCSHFPFLREKMQEIMGNNVKILDSAGAIARQVQRVLTNNKRLSSTKAPLYEFYTTNGAEKFINVSKKLVGEDLAEKIGKVSNTSL